MKRMANTEMFLRAPPEADGDNVSLHSLQEQQNDQGVNNQHGSSHRSPSLQPERRRSSKQFLEPPLTVPLRPLSPDTLSNLSIDEYQQLHEGPKYQELPRGSKSAIKLRTFWTRNLGLFYMLLAQVFGTAMNVTTRFLEVEGNNGKGLHPFQILFARMSITVVLASLYMWYTKTPSFPFGMPEVRLLLVARGLGGFFGVLGMYYSLLYLPLADATVITFLAPGLTCWACSFLIKEPFTKVEKIGTFVSLIGVIFIARPASMFSWPGSPPPATGHGDVASSPNATSHIGGASDYDQVTPKERIAAVGIALVGVCGAVCAYTTIRWIGKRAHPLISVNYFAVWCTIVSTVVQLTVPGIGFLFPASAKEWAMLIFLGSCGFIMQFLLSAGLSYERSSRATNMTYTSMLFAMSCDKIFFGVTPSVPSIIGSILILGAAVTMALQQARVNQDVREPQTGATDEERGLMGNMEEDLGRDEGPIPVQEVQLRTIR